MPEFHSLTRYLPGFDDFSNLRSSDPEEDNQDYLSANPTTAIGSASDPEESAPSDSGSPLFGSPASTGTKPPRVSAAYDALQSVNAERPVRTKPGFWRSLAALGVGLGAGYSNSTNHFQHIDVGKEVSGVLNGPYNKKMSDWEQKQKDALENLKGAQEADKEEQDYLDAPVKREETKANTDYLRSHTDLNRHQIDSEKARDRYLTLKDGSVYDTRNQETIWKPQTPPEERIAFAKQQGWNLNDPDIKGWIMDGKSPGDSKPDRKQLVEGKDGFHIVDLATETQKPVAGIPPKPINDPAANEAARLEQQDRLDQRRAARTQANNDQQEIDKLQKQEQALHKVRGAIGREMRKTDNEILADPETGKPVLDRNKKPMRRKDAPPEYWDTMRERLDQATREAQDLNDQQKRLAQRNGGGGAPPQSGGNPAVNPYR